MTDRAAAARRRFEHVIEHGNRGDPTQPPASRRATNWFRCADGAIVSVLAGWGCYCLPRPGFWPEAGNVPDDYPGPYVAVEVWFPDDDEPTAFVGVEMLRDWLYMRGGLVDYLDYPTQPEQAGWTALSM